MDLTGFGYLMFVVVAWLGDRALADRQRGRRTWLTACIYYFYATIDWRFAGLLLGLTAINHAAGTRIASSDDPRVRRTALAMAVGASLAVLFWFKYYNFFAESVNRLVGLVGSGPALPIVDVLLPVGISFITFQAITYPLDLYLGRLRERCGFADFVLFMAFFPRLLSGPIVRASYFLPQLGGAPPVDHERAHLEGVALVMRGLIKKVVLADTIGAAIVDPVFAAPGLYSTASVVLGAVAYSLQVYLDLSGYTDMALGVARLFGYRLPGNFDRPYLATSIANFWQRWHITMSAFFRDYLYRGLSAAFPDRDTPNLLVVFVLIGLWHGAGWNFVLYGAIHGSMVAIEHVRTRRRQAAGVAPTVPRGVALALRVSLVFGIVVATRVLFRCDGVEEAFAYYGAMLGSSSGSALAAHPAGLAALVAGIALHLSPTAWRDALTRRIAAAPPIAVGALFVAVCYLVNAFGSSGSGFIYFNF